MSGKLFRLWPAVVVAARLLWVGGATAQQGAPTNGEWRRIGGDGGNTRYSPLDQINADNVKNLKIAWTWKGDNFGGGLEIKNENTPLMVDGVLYFTAGDRRAGLPAAPRPRGAPGGGRVFKTTGPTPRVPQNNHGVAARDPATPAKNRTGTP